MIYLDNAATSWPKPPEVARAVGGVTEKFFGNPGRSGHKGALCAGRIVTACRERVCAFLGGEAPERVIFTLNCTDAVNIALRGMLHEGDEVLCSHSEHNAVMRVLAGYEEKKKITVSVLLPDADGLIHASAVHAAVTPRTALCVLCHASNVTGVLQPAREIADALHGYGIPLLLDAAQSCGSVDLSAAEADMIAMPGHKGLLGPMGTGILYLKPRMSPRPFREGGTGSDSDSLRQPDYCPDKYESGTLNLPGIAGLMQGVKFVSRHRAAIFEYEEFLIKKLRDGLENISSVTVYGGAGAPRVGVCSFNVGDRESAEIADLLSAQNICVRGGLHCAPCMHHYLGTASGTVRMSVGPFTTENEIDSALMAVQKLTRSP